MKIYCQNYSPDSRGEISGHAARKRAKVKTANWVYL